MNTKLNRKLKASYKLFNKRPEYRVGIQNDIILKDILNKIENEHTSLDNFIAFTNCLNFFYSTRLQTNIDKNRKSILNRNLVVVWVAKFLQANWNNGLMLAEERKTKSITVKKVDKMRKALVRKFGKELYSFTTKVFHQLNSQYPIIDRNVKDFIRRYNYKNKILLDQGSYKEFYANYLLMIKDIGWDQNDVDGFDIAMWVHISKQK